MSQVLSLMEALSSGVMSEEPFSPLMSRNQMMAVADSEPKMTVLSERLRGVTKVNTMRLIHITSRPKTKATATDMKMAMMTERALSVLSSSPRPSAPPEAIFTKARAKAPPSNSNTMLTVVEVGMPSELNTSSSTTSVTITARKMHITS